MNIIYYMNNLHLNKSDWSRLFNEILKKKHWMYIFVSFKKTVLIFFYTKCIEHPDGTC